MNLTDVRRDIHFGYAPICPRAGADGGFQSGLWPVSAARRSGRRFLLEYRLLYFIRRAGEAFV